MARPDLRYNVRGARHHGWGEPAVRMPQSVLALAVTDFLLFLVLWTDRSLHFIRSHPLAQAVPGAYWIAAAAGLVLSVYGFLVLTRGGKEYLQRSVVCVLFTMVPGCAALIAVLSVLGGRHLG